MSVEFHRRRLILYYCKAHHGNYLRVATFTRFSAANAINRGFLSALNLAPATPWMSRQACVCSCFGSHTGGILIERVDQDERRIYESGFFLAKKRKLDINCQKNKLLIAEGSGLSQTENFALIA